MSLIVGLGNPGGEYGETRHNVGFKVIDRLAEKAGIKLNQLKFLSLLGKGEIGGKRVILAKPLTYMNLSGEAVRKLVFQYKIPLKETIVIYDDINLDLGRIRIRRQGSHGGHNGVRSIIEQLGSDEFIRVRIGIGRPWGDVVTYVLSEFNEEEMNLLSPSLERAVEAVFSILSQGVEWAMNTYNKRD